MPVDSQVLDCHDGPHPEPEDGKPVRRSMHHGRAVEPHPKRHQRVGTNHPGAGAAIDAKADAGRLAEAGDEGVDVSGNAGAVGAVPSQLAPIERDAQVRRRCRP